MSRTAGNDWMTEEFLELNSATLQSVKEYTVGFIRGDMRSCGGKTIYGGGAALRFRLIVARSICPKYPEHEFTQAAICTLCEGSALVGFDHDLHILAYLPLKKAALEVQKYRDDLVLPENGKMEMVQFAAAVESRLPRIRPVDYFYTEEGNFDPFSKMRIKRKEIMKLQVCSAKGCDTVMVNFAQLPQAR